MPLWLLQWRLRLRSRRTRNYSKTKVGTCLRESSHLRAFAIHRNTHLFVAQVTYLLIFVKLERPQTVFPFKRIKSSRWGVWTVVVSKKTDGRSAITISSRKVYEREGRRKRTWFGLDPKVAKRRAITRRDSKNGFLSLHARNKWNMTNYISQRKRTLLAFHSQVHWKRGSPIWSGFLS
jgi:hypothetical protein